jgi:hypothetical protein
MELVDIAEFMQRTLGGWPTRMLMAAYEGNPFTCACGAVHQFSESAVQVMKELPKGRLVLSCPEGEHLTCIRLKGLEKPDFESLFGTVGIEEEHGNS